MQPSYDVISSFGGKTSYDNDNRPLLVMRSNILTAGYGIKRTSQAWIRQLYFFVPSRRRHTRCSHDWSSDVCSSDLSALPKACHVACTEVGRSFRRKECCSKWHRGNLARCPTS